MVITDFTKSPEQIIVDLINYDNDTNLEVQFLTFGLPVATPGTYNTRLTVTAVPSYHYTGSVDLTYNRIDFSDVPGARSISIEIGDAVNISDLVLKINQKYQLNLTPVDYVDSVLPIFDGKIVKEEKPFELIAGPNSLIFINKVTLNVIRNDIALSSVITNTVLNGLVYLQPV